MSGWQDSNLRPPRPKRGAIPGYATPRNLYSTPSELKFIMDLLKLSVSVILSDNIGQIPVDFDTCDPSGDYRYRLASLRLIGTSFSPFPILISILVIPLGLTDIDLLRFVSSVQASRPFPF